MKTLNLRRRLEGLERALQHRTRVLSLEETTDQMLFSLTGVKSFQELSDEQLDALNEQVVAIIAKQRGFDPQEWAAMPDEEKDAVIRTWR
jgi:hypothetical protein